MVGAWSLMRTLQHDLIAATLQGGGGVHPSSAMGMGQGRGPPC